MWALCFVYNPGGLRPNSLTVAVHLPTHIKSCSFLHSSHCRKPDLIKLSQLVSFNMQKLIIPLWNYNTLDTLFVL